MRKMNKWTSLLLAIVMVVSFMMPVGGNKAFAAEGLQISSLNVEADGTLEKGDTFDVQVGLILGTTDPVEKQEFSMAVSGAASGYTSISEITQSNDWVSFVIEGITYNGNGKTLQVEIHHALGKDISIVELDVETTTTAAEAVKVEENTINVVAGETQQINFRLKNMSKQRSTAGKMKLEVKEKNSTSKGIEIKKTKFDVPELSAGETKEFTTTLVINKDVTRGIHEMEVDIDGSKQIIKLKVDSDFMPPSLEVTVAGADGFKAGVPKDVTINLKNVGNIAARNVKVEVVSDAKVYVMDGSNVKYVESILSKETQSVKVKLQVSDTSASTVPVQLKFSYTDDLGEKIEDSQYIYLTTNNVIVDTELNIDNIIEPTGLYKVGQEFVVKFTVSGKGNLKNVKISVNGDAGIVPKSKNLFIIPEVKNGERKQYTVTMAATQEATNSTHPIEIKADYKVGDEAVTFSQYATVNISNPKKDDDDEEGKAKGKPKVIIGEYKSEPVIVKAGEEFDLEIGFLNTNKTKSVHNLKANLTIKEEGENDTGSVFTPVGASNTFFISDMAPGETVVKNIRLYTIPNAKPKTYEISLEMEYEDAEGNAITATEKLGIPVEQVTSLEVAEVRLETAQVGMETYMTAPIYNTGKTDISNVKISIQGEGFTVQDGTKFIGNFAKGASETYEPILTPTQAGTLLGTIVIQYETVTGEVENLTHDFELEVMDMPTMPEEEMFPEEGMLPEVEEEKPSKLPTVVGIIVGIAIAAGVTAVVLKKRKAKKDEFEVDED